MAYCITYLINIKGVAFNRLLDAGDQMPAERLDDSIRNQQLDIWDARLQDDDTEFLVDLIGEWTLCTHPYPYSNLLDAPPASNVVGRVNKWEQRLQHLLPSTEIYRVDDFLLDPWNARHDYLLIRNRQAVADFIASLLSQDQRYWSKLEGPKGVGKL